MRKVKWYYPTEPVTKVRIYILSNRLLPFLALAAAVVELWAFRALRFDVRFNNYIVICVGTIESACCVTRIGENIRTVGLEEHGRRAGLAKCFENISTA
jgi:hypothetical protein